MSTSLKLYEKSSVYIDVCDIMVCVCVCVSA